MSNFDNAFAKARKSGKKVFSFGGKSYNTKLADSAPKKKTSSLPKTTTVIPTAKPVAEASGRRNGAFNPTQQQGRMSGASDGVKQPSGPSARGKGRDASFFGMTETNRMGRNDFRQSESRRSSDYSTGKANAPKVKRAIGKFMLGKGYKD